MTEPKPVYTVASHIEPYPHWSETADRQTFVQAVADLGLDGNDVPAILGVERVCHFEGTVEDAVDCLVDYAHRNRQNIRDSLHPSDVFHSEAQAIAWTNTYLPDGTQVNVTARQGASPDDIVSTVLALTDALETLRQFGIRTTKQPLRVTPPVQVNDAPGPTDFWKAARKHIGPGRPFENKDGAARWLTQFSTGKGFNWIDAIKALHSLKPAANNPAEALVDANEPAY